MTGTARRDGVLTPLTVAVRSCGGNELGQLGIGTRDPKEQPTLVASLAAGVHEISVGLEFTCAIGADTADYCWGGKSYGQLGNGDRRGALMPAPVEP